MQKPSKLAAPNIWRCLLCRPAAMHRIPLAHAFCNGLIKGFWALMARSGKRVLRWGDDIILSKEARAVIKRKVQELRGTTCFTAALPDIIQCDASSPDRVEGSNRQCVCLWGFLLDRAVA